MTALERRDWVPDACEAYVQELAARTASNNLEETQARIDALIAENLPDP
jgi:glycine hydroxymethyltransferase